MFYGSATGIEFEHLVYDCSVCRMPFRPSDNGDDACPVHGDREPERRFKGHGQAFGSAVWRLECCGKMFLGSGDAGGDDDEAQIGLCRAAVEDGSRVRRMGPRCVACWRQLTRSCGPALGNTCA